MINQRYGQLLPVSLLIDVIDLQVRVFEERALANAAARPRHTAKARSGLAVVRHNGAQNHDQVNLV